MASLGQLFGSLKVNYLVFPTVVAIGIISGVYLGER